MPREEVRRLRESLCADACPRCPRNCCTGRLNPRLDRMERFRDLPLVRGPLDPRPRPQSGSASEDRSDEACRARPERGKGPYVLQQGLLRERFLVGRCPHLTEGMCGIYGDPGRPRECHEYPLHVQSVLGGLGGQVLHVERSCWIFDDEARVEEARALAARLGIDCIVNP